MNNLIIIAHPDKNSFCYNGILKTIVNTLKEHREELHCIDLYEENKSFYFGKEKSRNTRISLPGVIASILYLRYGGLEQPQH